MESDHTLSPSFRTYPDELTALFSSIEAELPVTTCIMMSVHIWGFEYTFSTGEMTIHRLNDARLSDTPDTLYDRVLGAVTTMSPSSYRSEIPIDLKSIVVKVKFIACVVQLQ